MNTDGLVVRAVVLMRCVWLGAEQVCTGTLPYLALLVKLSSVCARASLCAVCSCVRRENIVSLFESKLSFVYFDSLAKMAAIMGSCSF